MKLKFYRVVADGHIDIPSLNPEQRHPDWCWTKADAMKLARKYAKHKWKPSVEVQEVVTIDTTAKKLVFAALTPTIKRDDRGWDYGIVGEVTRIAWNKDGESKRIVIYDEEDEETEEEAS